MFPRRQALGPSITVDPEIDPKWLEDLLDKEFPYLSDCEWLFRSVYHSVLGSLQAWIREFKEKNGITHIREERDVRRAWFDTPKIVETIEGHVSALIYVSRGVRLRLAYYSHRIGALPFSERIAKTVASSYTTYLVEYTNTRLFTGQQKP